MKGKTMGWFGVLVLFFIAVGASLNGLGLVGFWEMFIIMMLPHGVSAGWAVRQKLLEDNKTA